MIGGYARLLSIVLQIRGISLLFFWVHGCDRASCYALLVGYPHDGYEMANGKRWGPVCVRIECSVGIDRHVAEPASPLIKGGFFLVGE